MAQTATTTTTTAASGSVEIKSMLTLSVTDLAKAKLGEFLQGRSIDSVGVRVSVMPGGCSGASYGMEFADKAEPGELTINANGVNLFVHPDHAQLLNGVSIDFVDELMGGGFKIANPNAKSGCGCGKSFSA